MPLLPEEEFISYGDGYTPGSMVRSGALLSSEISTANSVLLQSSCVVL